MPAGWNGGPVLAVPAWLPVEGVVAVLPVGNSGASAAPQSNNAVKSAVQTTTLDLLISHMDALSGEIQASTARVSALATEPKQRSTLETAIATLELQITQMRRSLGLPEPVSGPLQIIQGSGRSAPSPVSPRPPARPSAAVEEATETAAPEAAAPEAAAPEAAPEAAPPESLDLSLARELLSSIVAPLQDTARQIIPGAKKMRDYARTNIYTEFLPDVAPIQAGVVLAQTWRKLQSTQARASELPADILAEVQALSKDYDAQMPQIADSLSHSMAALIDLENRLNHFAGYRKSMTPSQVSMIDANLPPVREMVATHRKILELAVPPAPKPGRAQMRMRP